MLSRDSNPWLLGEQQECFLCATQPPKVPKNLPRPKIVPENLHENEHLLWDSIRLKYVSKMTNYRQGEESIARSPNSKRLQKGNQIGFSDLLTFIEVFLWGKDITRDYKRERERERERGEKGERDLREA